MRVRLAATAILFWTIVVPAFAQESPDQRTKQPADLLEGPPLVTAKGWIIGDGRTGRRLWGQNDETARPIASTTKMMTAWLVLQLIDQDQTLLDQVTTFSERADKTTGSTSGIAAGEQVTIRDLLYGLLLPSGNDAAMALAMHFGGTFAQKNAEGQEPAELTADQGIAAFVEAMNRTAKKLEMAETHYLDPHGLAANRSSPRDLLRLATTAMQSETFRRYVQTERHECTVTTAAGDERKVVWNNTNQLLAIEGFDGVKTGTTNAAGACLVASCRRGERHLVAVVLGSALGDGRYVDTRNLLRWAWLQLATTNTAEDFP